LRILRRPVAELVDGAPAVPNRAAEAEDVRALLCLLQALGVAVHRYDMHRPLPPVRRRIREEER